MGSSVLWLVGLLFAQASGLRGVVLDRNTREPVIGAGISEIHHRYGTYTDINGTFVLPRGRIGDTLVITHVAYRPETLRVRHTTLRIHLTPNPYVMPPVVVQETPFTQRLKTTGTVYIRRGQELEHLGWEEPWRAITAFPGVVTGHVRGGRLEENVVTLDGAPIVDNVRREVVFQVPSWAIQQMQFRTSGFEPEYGDVSAGLVLLTSKKTGLRPSFRGSIKADLTAPPLGDPYREYQVGAFFSHPRGFVSLYGTVSGTRFWKYWRSARPYPIHASVDYLANYTLSWHRHLWVLQGLGHFSRWREYEHRWRYYLQGLPLRQRESHRWGLLYTGNLSDRWGLDLTLLAYVLNYQVLGKKMDEYNLDYELDSLGFVRNGDKPIWTDRFQTRWFAKAKVHYFSPKVLAYAGAELNTYDLYNRTMDIYLDWQPGYNFWSALVYLNHYHYRPYSQALFASLKFRDGPDMVHLGLRYDRFQPRARRPAVELPPEWPPPEWIYDSLPMVPASPKAQWSPRVGIIHRARHWIIRLNYGMYFQMPEFQYLYSNPTYNVHRGFLALVGNPDLKPSQTHLYEYSVIWAPSPEQQVQVNLFHRTSDHLVDALRILPDTATYTDLAEGYTVYDDVGEASTTGLEVSWEGYRPGLSWTLSYTLMRALGTYGYWLQENQWQELEGVRIEPGMRYPLSWDQTHTVAAQVTIGDPENRYLSVYFKWGSGLPYSPTGGPPNSKRLPPNYQARIVAGWAWRSLQFRLRIENPLNHRNVVFVDGHGRPGGRLHDPRGYSEGRRLWIETVWQW